MNIIAHKVAIHQPNFFPWLGFFNKIHKSDVFVFLNHVENNPRTAIYTKRVKILVNKKEHWLTLSLKNDSAHIFVPINKMLIDHPERQRDKHLKTMELNYKRAPFYHETFPLVEEFYRSDIELISERNIQFIRNACGRLNIDAKFIYSDKLDIHTSSNQLLIDIIKKVGGSTYIPGGGASGYQEDELLKLNGIELEHQNYMHPSYKQFNSPSFFSGLSVVDALMNIGFEETERLIKNG